MNKGITSVAPGLARLRHFIVGGGAVPSAAPPRRSIPAKVTVVCVRFPAGRRPPSSGSASPAEHGREEAPDLADDIVLGWRWRIELIERRLTLGKDFTEAVDQLRRPGEDRLERKFGHLEATTSLSAVTVALRRAPVISDISPTM